MENRMADSAESLLNLVPLAVYVVEANCEGIPVFAEFNGPACQLFDVECEKVVGRTALDVLPSPLAKLFYHHHYQSIQGAQIDPLEFLLVVDGDRRHFRTVLVPERRHDGSVSRVVGTTIDVSAEQELNTIRDISAEASREIEEFIYLAAHDLRAPMRNVTMIADFLREDFQDLGDGKLELIDKLESVASTAVTLVGSILSHAEAHDRTVVAEKFTLATMCGDIATMLDPGGTHQKRIHDALLCADKNAVQIALNNLISNAFKHNATGSVVLTVSARSVEPGFIEFTVQDDGKGIAKPDLLFQADERNRSQSGFGLLAIRRMIKLRGGHIHAETGSSGQGLAVIFSLPGMFAKPTPTGRVGETR